MLPEIEIDARAAVDDRGNSSPLRFSINGHRLEFRGSAAEIYTMRRDLEDARKFINAARSLHAMLAADAGNAR